MQPKNELTLTLWLVSVLPKQTFLRYSKQKYSKVSSLWAKNFSFNQEEYNVSEQGKTWAELGAQVTLRC